MIKKKIEKNVNKEAVVFTFYGGLTAEIRNELDKINVDNLERDVVIFDFSQAEYICSSVLGWVTGIRTELVAQNKREPIVVGCNEKILNLFEMTGVVHLFKFA